MKHLSIILIFLSTSSFANGNQVVSAVTKHNTETENNILVSAKSTVEELTLRSCDVEVLPFKSNGDKIKLIFSNRIFIADSISFKPKINGKCMLTLKNGYGVQ